MMMRTIDRCIIDKFQRAYLWLYDWTGVRVGLLTLVLGVAIIGVKVEMIFLDYIFLLWVLVASWLFYNDQAQERIEQFNRRVEIAINSWSRVCLNVVVLADTPFAVVRPNLEDVGYVTLWFMLSYVMTVKIRKREPKEFWVTQTATGGVNG